MILYFSNEKEAKWKISFKWQSIDFLKSDETDEHDIWLFLEHNAKETVAIVEHTLAGYSHKLFFESDYDYETFQLYSKLKDWQKEPYNGQGQQYSFGANTYPSNGYITSIGTISSTPLTSSLATSYTTGSTINGYGISTLGGGGGGTSSIYSQSNYTQSGKTR